MSLRAQFCSFDDELARHGVPPLVEWWREGLGRWLDAYEQGQVLELWACVGRGAAKSTALYRLATYFTLFGEFRIPPGERHFAIVLSRLKEEASKGIAIIDRWLTLLNVAHHLAGDVIELDSMPRGLRVAAASVAASSGWRAYFVGKDERSKWAAGGVEELDAEEVDTSAIAMTATHRLAPIVTVGSAWGAFGGFYDAITGGTDAHRVVLGPAATWTAAPHISEASCRAKERDPRRFAREYACQFQSGSLGCFDLEDIDRAFESRPQGNRGGSTCVIDASSGRKDNFTCGIFHREAPGSFVRFTALEGIAPTEARALGASGVVARIASIARKAGCSTVHGDQRESFALASEFAKVGIHFIEHTWTAQSKPEAVERVRAWFRDAAIALPHHPVLRNELLNFEERISPGGSFTFGARGNGHDDFVSLLVTASMCIKEGTINQQAIDSIRRKEAALARFFEDGHDPEGAKTRAHARAAEALRDVRASDAHKESLERNKALWAAHLAKGDKDVW